MQQKISDRISNAILDYREGETLQLVYGPWNAALDEVHMDKSEHVGVRLTYAVNKRETSLRELLAKAMRALDQAAFDEGSVDYLEIVRVKADSKKEEASAMELVQVVAKRSIWVNT